MSECEQQLKVEPRKLIKLEWTLIKYKPSSNRLNKKDCENTNKIIKQLARLI